jgi:DNA-directed RNA polymerase subunit alpha
VESYDEGYETDAYQGTGEYADGQEYNEGDFQETEQL